MMSAPFPMPPAAAPSGGDTPARLGTDRARARPAGRSPSTDRGGPADASNASGRRETSEFEGALNDAIEADAKPAATTDVRIASDPDGAESEEQAAPAGPSRGPIDELLAALAPGADGSTSGDVTPGDEGSDEERSDGELGPLVTGMHPAVLVNEQAPPEPTTDAPIDESVGSIDGVAGAEGLGDGATTATDESPASDPSGPAIDQNPTVDGEGAPLSTEAPGPNPAGEAGGPTATGAAGNGDDAGASDEAMPGTSERNGGARLSAEPAATGGGDGDDTAPDQRPADARTGAVAPAATTSSADGDVAVDPPPRASNQPATTATTVTGVESGRGPDPIDRAGPPAPGSAPTPDPDGADGADPVWRQLGRALGSLRTNTAGEQQLTVRLSPAELGSVTIRVTANENGTSVGLVADSSMAVARLQSQRSLLESELRASGLTDVAVDIGGGDAGTGERFDRAATDAGHGRDDGSPPERSGISWPGRPDRFDTGDGWRPLDRARFTTLDLRRVPRQGLIDLDL